MGIYTGTASPDPAHKIALYQVLNRSGIFRAQFLAGGGIGGLTSPPNNVSLATPYGAPTTCNLWFAHGISRFL